MQVNNAGQQVEDGPGEGGRGGDREGERLIDQDLRGKEEEGFYSLGTRELLGSSEQVMNPF